MNANTNPTTQVLETNYAQKIAAERIDEIINQLERFKGEVQRYADRYAEAEDNAERAKVINWTIHHITTNLMCNLRIDLLADSQAALAKLGK